MNILVIGGGPAGMMAAYTAAQAGHAVTLVEQNEKLGKKLYLTGKGRCNVTNAGGKESFFSHVVRNPRFLYSAYNACTAEDIISLLEKAGVALKIERGDRVFPASDKSSDIIRGMEKLLAKNGVRIQLCTSVKSILADEAGVTGIQTNTAELRADAVILATGGASYPSTGSTGDGYRFAHALGHTIISPTPSLVPLETEESWPGELSGMALKNIRLKAVQDGKAVYDELGEMLFAHFGVTGPLVLSASACLAERPEGARLFIDLKPGLTPEQLDQRLQRDLQANQRASLKTAFSGLLPRNLLPVVLRLSDIDEKASASEFPKALRIRLAETLKALPLTVRAARPLAEAIITRGGVSVKEIQASTLESKLVRGLYFAGEILDVDALTGGYNLQIAWSTGALAGLLK